MKLVWDSHARDNYLLKTSQATPFLGYIPHMKLQRIFSVFSIAALSVALMAPTAHAAKIKPMDTELLQQMVLRVQFPTTLGNWEQSLYNITKDAKPTVCYGAKGPIYLPVAKNSGNINYAVGPDASGTVSVFQYETKAKATKALKALRAAQCTSTPLVPSEAERLVKGTQSTDRIDEKFTGLAGSMIYVEPGEEMRGYFSTFSTQRGLAIVQTVVTKFVKEPQSVEEQNKFVNQTEDVNKSWHPRVVKAYENFGIQGRSR